MDKREREAMDPVSLAVYQQMVFDRAADLLSAGCDTQTVIDRLIDMSDYLIKAPTVKVVIEGGVVQDVLSDTPVELENKDCDQLRAYRDRLYMDKSLKSCDYRTANFAE